MTEKSHSKIMHIINEIKLRYKNNIEDFRTGDCGTLAIALRSILGFGEYLVVVNENEPEYFSHVLLSYDNKYYDISGIKSKKELIEDYTDEDGNPPEFLEWKDTENNRHAILKYTMNFFGQHEITPKDIIKSFKENKIKDIKMKILKEKLASQSDLDRINEKAKKFMIDNGFIKESDMKYIQKNITRVTKANSHYLGLFQSWTQYPYEMFALPVEDRPRPFYHNADDVIPRIVINASWFPEPFDKTIEQTIIHEYIHFMQWINGDNKNKTPQNQGHTAFFYEIADKINKIVGVDKDSFKYVDRYGNVQQDLHHLESEEIEPYKLLLITPNKPGWNSKYYFCYRYETEDQLTKFIAVNLGYIGEMSIENISRHKVNFYKIPHILKGANIFDFESTKKSNSPKKITMQEKELYLKNKIKPMSPSEFLSNRQLKRKIYAVAYYTGIKDEFYYGWFETKASILKYLENKFAWKKTENDTITILQTTEPWFCLLENTKLMSDEGYKTTSAEDYYEIVKQLKDLILIKGHKHNVLSIMGDNKENV